MAYGKCEIEKTKVSDVGNGIKVELVAELEDVTIDLTYREAELLQKQLEIALQNARTGNTGFWS